MLYSRLFGQTKKTVTSQYEAKSHELLTKAGYIDQVASGLFTYLPLGKKVLAKIEAIIREELEAIGAQEILMPSLHPKKFWQQTNRWKTVDVLFKTKSRYGQEYGLGPTHEEIVTPLAKKFINSYRDLPLALYHITSKFRDEPRPKSGILRGREFGMKDLYSFHQDKNDLNQFYQEVTRSYLKIFQRCGLNEIKITEASGGTFSKNFSHEFNVLTPAGEVDLIYCDQCSFAQNEEIAKVKSGNQCPKCHSGKIKKDRAIEIGNIFNLGTRFSKDFNLTYRDKDGQDKLVVMGCYGIGTTRLMGAIVEINHDNQGIIWPKNIAPYQAILVGLDLRNRSVKKRAYSVYNFLLEKKIDLLFDDREETGPGEKLTDADLIGIPIRLVVSAKTKDKIEIKERKNNKIQLVELEKTIKKLLS